MAETIYALGHSAAELRRLELQATLFAPGTRRILRAAGLREGMSVLDIGTGVGDVAILAADIVGASGSVLGIDREASVLARAASRASDAGLTQIRYEEHDLMSIPAPQACDAVVGRYVLLHQPERVAFIRRAADLVRPGGTLLFIEPGLSRDSQSDATFQECWSHPRVPLAEKVLRLIIVAFTLVGVDLATSVQLPELFHEAGLSETTLLHEGITGVPQSVIVEWYCSTLRSMLPVLEAHRVTTAMAVGVDTLHERLEAALSDAGSEIRVTNMLSGGWTRVGQAHVS